MAKKKIDKYVFKPGTSYLSNRYPNAYKLFADNYKFIQAELTAFLNQEIIDSAKCERDIEYIIDGLVFDIALQTNYNSKFLGLAEFNSLDISPTVVRTIQRMRNKIISIGDVSADVDLVHEINALIDDIIDIATNGRSAADDLVYTSPSNITAQRENAKQLILANTDWFYTEVNAYVAETYPSADHDVDKCTRDIKYALESLLYDITYQGNSASYDSAKFFYYYNDELTPGIDPTHRVVTVAAYDHLQSIISNTLQGLLVINTDGNALSQDLTGDASDEATALEAVGLLDIVKDVIDNGPSALDNYTRSLPSLIGAPGNRITAKNAIEAAKDSIIENSVAFSGYTYNLDKCERDLGYILDSYLYDMRYGGNQHTVKVAAKYWDQDVAQIDGNRLPELDGHAFVRELITDYIFKNVEYDNKQELVQQTLDISISEELTNYTPDTAIFTPTTGTLFLNIGAHTLQVGDEILIQEESLTFTYDGETDSYPRGAGVFDSPTLKDSYFNRALKVTDTTSTSITVNIGITDKTSAWTFEGATSGAIVTGARTSIFNLAGITLDVIENGLSVMPTEEKTGVGTIKVQGRFNSADLLLMTNTTVNEIIYSFSDPQRGGFVTVEEKSDGDYPKFLQTTDGVTTIELNYDTSAHSASDSVQIFVEEKEIRTRPFDFGTDAIERMRVAAPLSMLDADFEYGLQPTKWSAIATMRGYPSIYEVPGTETEVVSVITDSSAGTEGIGASLITITTVGAHGWEPGTPITIKGLETGVTGSGRAEGSFVVVTVPAPNQITFYAKGKVGAEGDDLATSFTQLRQAGFYTGADVGLPSFDILSNGSAGTLTTALKVEVNDDTIPFNGDRPEIGAPLVAGGIVLGTQVTSVIGQGGIEVTPTTAADILSGSTTLTVDDPSGVEIGLVLDRGDGFGATITNIVGNDLSLSSPLAKDFVGNVVTYNNIVGQNDTSQGAGALFDISRAGGVYSLDQIAAPGQNYAIGDVIVIFGNDLGGSSPEHDLEITVDTVETDGSLLTVTLSGNAFDGNAVITGVNGTYNNGNGNGGTYNIEFENNVYTSVTEVDPTYFNVNATPTGGNGTGLAFDVTVTDNVYTVAKDPSTAIDYQANDIVVISGTEFEGGVSPDNDLTIKILTVDGAGSPDSWDVFGVGPDITESFVSPPFQNSGSGIGAVFNVDKVGSVYSVNFSITGSGFAPGDLLTVSGNDLSGVAPTNNCVIEILTVDVGGEILTYSVTGTGTNTKFFAFKTGTNIVGNGASFDVSITGQTYNITLAQPGSNFADGQEIVIDGLLVGGLSVTNDITITIDTVTLADSTGALGSINTFTPSGTASFSTTGYVVGDRIKFDGANFSGGATGVNDLFLEVTSVGTEGNILTFDIVGTAPDAVVEYVTPPSTTSGSGQDADFTVTRTGTTYTAQLNAIGTNYLPNEIITIDGADLGGVSTTNDLTITVNTVDTNGEILTYTETGTAFNGSTKDELVGSTLVGTGANFTVTLSGGSYTVSPSSGGQDYGPNQTFTVLGNQVNGASPANDLTITVATVDSTGAILTATATGNASTDVGSFTNVGGSVRQPTGFGASFDVVRTGTNYVATVNATGSDYNVGDRIVLSGGDLGGVPITNDLTVIISIVSTSGAIVDFTTSGTGSGGDSLDLYSAITLSEPVEAELIKDLSVTFEALATIEVNFATAHGIVPGASFITTILSDDGLNNHLLASGSFIASSVPTITSVTYQARAAGTIETSAGLDNIRGEVYLRPDSFFTHRPYDGGVQLGTGGPQYGAQAIRQSKKYIRYQSGKGIMYTTGALFAPSYDLRSATSDGIEVGSTITVTCDDNDHGMQVGGYIRLLGIETPGYNGEYIVTNIVSERVFQVQAGYRLGSTDAVLSFAAQVSVLGWHGATVRSGIFDDQNGIFWEFDGTNVQVSQRTSTKQVAGTINAIPDENRISGTNTRFRDQLTAGDRVVLRGMTHVVTHISSQTEMTVAPDYRGVNPATGAKLCLVTDKKVRQAEFNLDSLDGNGPSGYNIDIAKMQMIGIQYSWYGAGFIDFMLRGADGNFVFAHRMRNSNVNTEAFMRSGNLPVRYEVTNEGAYGKLREDMDAAQTFVPIENAEFFPTSGTVYIDNEIITFSGVDYETNNLTGCNRSANLINFQAGATRSYSAGDADAHNARTGVILISNTITPLISHWGSAFITDGQFDEDRGYIFSYAETGITVDTSRQTAFLIRLAPSVSNAVTGDLGDRELLNRAQLLLQGIEITSDAGSGGIVVEGILNPQNYPVNPSSVGWEGLSGLAQGGQPSFAQVAPGGSITWTTGNTSITVDLEALSPLSTTLNTGIYRSPRGANYVYVNASDYRSTFGTTNLDQVIGTTITGTNIPAGTTIIGGQINSGNDYGYFRLSDRISNNINQNQSNYLTVTQGGNLDNRNFALISATSWESSGAKSGDEVAISTTNPTFPAGTRISSVSQREFAGSTFYEVTFNNTFQGTLTAGSGTVTLEFSQPAYAQPGETVFSFIANPGERSTLSLDQLKELTNTPLGGRGTFPNGPDVLAINVYKVSGVDISANIVLKWGEAQA